MLRFTMLYESESEEDENYYTEEIFDQEDDNLITKNRTNIVFNIFYFF